MEIPKVVSDYASRGRANMKTVNRAIHSIIGYPSRIYRWENLSIGQAYALRVPRFESEKVVSLIQVDDSFKKSFPDFDDFKYSEPLKSYYFYLESAKSASSRRVEFGLYTGQAAGEFSLQLVNWGLDSRFVFPNRLFLEDVSIRNGYVDTRQIYPSQTARNEK